MENLGAMADSRYTGFCKITDRDVLELHCSDEFDFYVFTLTHWPSSEPLCEPNFYVISVLRVASGSRVKLAGRKSALNPRWFILLTVLRRWSRC